MKVSSKSIISLTRARAKLTELCNQVKQERGEIILTKNGKRHAALIDADRLEYYHRLERGHVHLILLDDTVRGVEEVNAGKVFTAPELYTRYGLRARAKARQS